jgi:CRISPR-associated protein Cas8a1/Csx13
VGELSYRLTNPGYTIYHRAALGGLAATMKALEGKMPEGLSAEVTADTVRIWWPQELADREAVARLLASSFRLTEDKMIDLPGQGIPDSKIDLRLAIHNALCVSFLQHPKMRPGEKAARSIVLRGADDDVGQQFTYKAINSYVHQSAKGTGLFDVDRKRAGKLQVVASVSQALIPGATAGVGGLDLSSDEIVLLLYLMVGAPVFLLRPRAYQERAQACVVVPDVRNLVEFARALRAMAAPGRAFQGFSDTYLGRVVGGAEEAALRLLLELAIEDIAFNARVTRCRAIAMGKVAWDKNQINRSQSFDVNADHSELGVFRAAYTHLGRSKVLPGKSGAFAVPESAIPELVAANLTGGRHWASSFAVLVKTKKEAKYLGSARKGLQHMKEAIRDVDDKTIIEAFQEAWRKSMAKIYGDAKRDGANGDRRVEVERERVRNSILRSKTSDALAGWFLRFCADASKDGALSAFQVHGERLRLFLFEPRNVDRLQNLLLFALVSYAKPDKAPVDRQAAVSPSNN